MAFKMKGSPMARNYGAPFASKDNGDVELKGKHDQKVKGSRRPILTAYDEEDDTSNAPVFSGARRDDKKDSKERANTPPIPEHLKSTGIVTES